MSDQPIMTRPTGTSQFQPKPGSLEAVLADCTCPVYDNQFGRGYRWTPGTESLYLLDPSCPLHQDEIAEVTPC